jgi:diguanylate cyclase (GGDEF)-like protein/PAS domain S-box-containing protein
MGVCGRSTVFPGGRLRDQVSSLPAIHPALLALHAVIGTTVLGIALVALWRLPHGRHRTAWALWSAALVLDLAATAFANGHAALGIDKTPGIVESVLAVAALLAAAGVVARLPQGAFAGRQLILDQVPLVLAVVSVASITYGGGVDDSPSHFAAHVAGPAAFMLLASICIAGIRYVGGRSAPRSAQLLTLGFVLSAVAGISPAFVADPAALTYPRVIAWFAGMTAIGLGAALRVRHLNEDGEYTPRLDPIRGWSWGAMVGIVLLFVLAFVHRGPEESFRQITAVLALGCFVARSLIARRESIHLLAELRGAEARYRTLVEQIPLAIYTDALDDTSTAQYVSPAIHDLTGYTREEVEGHPEWFPTVLHPDDRWVLDAMHEWHADGTPWEQEFRLVAKDGSVRWVRDRAVIVCDDHGTPLHAQGFLQDVSARKRAETDLHESERRYRDTLEGVNLLALQLDLEGTVTFCNDHVCEVTGWSRGELVGRNWYETVGPVERELSFLQAVREDDLEDGSEERLRTRAGGDRVIKWWDTVSRDADGAVVGVNSIGQDITEQRQAEDRVVFLLDHDEPTGLPNRTLFTRRVAEAIGRARWRGRSVGVVIVNLENFRLVNDAYGHAVGDAVLCQFADRLRHAAGAAPLVARHGGDEFVVLLADMTDDSESETHTQPADVAQMATALVGQVQHVLRRPFVNAGHEIYLSVRSGVGIYPTEANTGEDLLKSAHVNAYRPSATTHRADLAASELVPREELELIARMHHAIERREFLLHYQPVIDMATGRMTGVEALIRWQPPAGPMIPPNDFIPLAERTGLIAQITQWVLEQVCTQKAEWRRRGIDLAINFNFPIGMWDEGTLVNMIALMAAHGLAPDDLVIEVTESAVVTDADLSSGALDVVREHGMRLAIDDFGTGLSSLGRLRELPAAVIKIDRSFVRDLPNDRSAVKLADVIIRVARTFNMRALAEGIETEEQRALLADLGCDLGQGFLFSRPVPVAEIEAMFADERRQAA